MSFVREDPLLRQTLYARGESHKMKLRPENSLTDTWSRIDWRCDFHYLLTALAIVTLFPALNIAKFPLRWDWTTYWAAYLILAFRSGMVAAVLYVISYPGKSWTLLQSLWMDKPKLIITLVYTTVLFAAIGPAFGSVVLIDTIALIEILSRNRQNGKKAIHVTASLLPAAAYLFFGLIIVFTFVNIIVRVRYYATFDNILNDLDKRLLGTSVMSMAHYASEILPKQTFRFLDFIYYSMFPQIGAALIICGISSGSRQSLQFVGTVLLSYYMAVILFFLLPSAGPFYFHGNHFDRLISDLPSYTTQKYMILNPQYLWEQKPVHVIPTGYYISFPCMHVANPLVVLWYLRKWKRMVAVLLAYDVLLVAAILLLEWHYFVDILGGVAVAGVAVLVMGYASATDRSPLVAGQLEPQ
jgi:hypothetical protein